MRSFRRMGSSLTRLCQPLEVPRAPLTGTLEERPHRTGETVAQTDRPTPREQERNAASWATALWTDAPQPDAIVGPASSVLAAIHALASLSTAAIHGSSPSSTKASSAKTSSTGSLSSSEALARALNAYLSIPRGASSPLVPTDPNVDLGRVEEPALRVGHLIARGLAADIQGEDGRALLEQARLASRAAYAESLPLLEYLAYWLLARARRVHRTPHAAARITAACARVVPTAWRPLIDWELILAGGSANDIDRPLAGPAALWAALLSTPAAERAEALHALRTAPLPPRFARERDLLCSGFDGVDAGDEEEALYLASAVLPTLSDQDGSFPAAWWVTAQRRRLHWTTGLPASSSASPPRVAFGEGERIPEAIATLAQTPGVPQPLEIFFRAVYGFTFVPETHDGVVRTLLHRARTQLGAHGDIVRQKGQVHLQVHHPFVCPAPRSAPGFGDQLLRLIALQPGVHAGELARLTGSHLRTVQRTLRLLADAGACEAKKAGRRLTFFVEDTTFSEPTHFGASPGSGGHSARRSSPTRKP